MESSHSSRSKYLPPVFWPVVVFLAAAGLTRVTLILLHITELSSALWYLPVSLLLGMVFDFFVALCITLPVVLLIIVVPFRWRNSRWLRWPLMAVFGMYTFGIIFLGFTELFFFDEFNSRLNYIAVDYLIYPHEVFINIWDTYPVLTVLIITAALAFLTVWLLRKKIGDSIKYPVRLRSRLGVLAGYAVLIALGWLTINIDSARISDNRALNEITRNGVYSFFHAAFTNELDYNQYYASIDKQTAEKRLRTLLDDDHTRFLAPDDPRSIDRYITSDNPRRNFNIVLVLEESFGSNFIGRLHPEGKSLTPEFERIAKEHGRLFTHVYATGNRTVRGMEATLASFPPIPGRSIVKRPGCEGVFTISSVLKNLGYNTAFIYGGLSYFDNIGAFAAGNGYDRVFDELDFKNPTFKTIWGVCDEDLFGKGLETLDSLHSLNSPFFVTLLTVSNHSPYTYPEGRIPYDPKQQIRENAVRYADYSIGKFIDDAKSYDFFDSTLFVFVADHGARVYGSEQIPMESYEIPLLFYNPILMPQGDSCSVRGSQLDISPTILDLIGIDYNSEFFGRSLLFTQPDQERVLMSHNRDVSLMRDSMIAVLGIQGGCGFWSVDTSTGKFDRIEQPLDSTIETDAIAYYMTAYDLFRDHLMHPLQQPTNRLAAAVK